MAACNVIVIINCLSVLDPALNIIVTIGNITKLATPFVLSILRYNDPIIRERLHKVLGINKKDSLISTQHDLVEIQELSREQ